jgi:hypothetical protein
LYTEDNVTVIVIDTEIDTVTVIDTVPRCGRRGERETALDFSPERFSSPPRGSIFL